MRCCFELCGQNIQVMLNSILWVLQVFIAIIFVYSGVCKMLLPEEKLLVIGQTGVEGLSPSLITFIGIAEIAGAIGLIAPMVLQIATWLTPVTALCLALIMPFAARIHYRRNEPGCVRNNAFLFLLCLFIACGRIFLN